MIVNNEELIPTSVAAKMLQVDRVTLTRNWEKWGLKPVAYTSENRKKVIYRWQIKDILTCKNTSEAYKSRKNYPKRKG